ncbi:Phage protein [Candidatus Ornithobacterium hominis]|uniref:hypothetical protein n=1 Tax=Candidatus Ornithobacterium hominis TaxID=2497989 RepID=UPI0024BCDDC9|nr:hypothetical protein [Candidatus Ornithobacterium hominis]CAI9429726.1 Phage protein [Candidatus Ornithobacterium hominis]
MKIKETTIYRDHILFENENESGVFVVRVDFNKDNVGVRSTDNDNEIVEISEEERNEWLERRDVILEKYLKLEKLYNEIMCRENQIYELVREFKYSLDSENSTDQSLIYVADKVSIDYSDLERETSKMHIGVLHEYKKRKEREK